MKKILLIAFLFVSVNLFAQNIVINKKVVIESTSGTITIPGGGTYIQNVNVQATPIINSGSAQYCDVAVNLNPVNSADLDITVFNHVWNDYTASGENLSVYLRIEFQLCNNETLSLTTETPTIINLFGETVKPQYFRKSK